MKETLAPTAYSNAQALMRAGHQGLMQGAEAVRVAFQQRLRDLYSDVDVGIEARRSLTEDELEDMGGHELARLLTLEVRAHHQTERLMRTAVQEQTDIVERLRAGLDEAIDVLRKLDTRARLRGSLKAAYESLLDINHSLDEAVGHAPVAGEIDLTGGEDGDEVEAS